MTSMPPSPVTSTGRPRQQTAAEALHHALSGDIRLPKPQVHTGRVYMDDIDIDTAQRLDNALSAIEGEKPTQDGDPERIAARLIRRLRRMSGNGFLHAELMPHCMHCGADEMIRLDSITMDQANTFAQAVSGSAPELHSPESGQVDRDR